MCVGDERIKKEIRESLFHEENTLITFYVSFLQKVNFDELNSEKKKKIEK